MKTLIERASYLLELCGNSVTNLANIAGVKPPSVSDWLNGKTKTLKAAPAHRVSKHFNINQLWLTEGVGPMRDNAKPKQQSQTSSQLLQPTEEEFALVQQLDLAASCGPGRFVDHVIVKGGLAFKRSSLRDFGVQEANARIIYATGNSMDPSIGHGRVVLVDTADIKATDNRVFLICDPDGSILLKRLVREFYPASGDMRWIMRSDNPNKTEYPDKLLPNDDRTIIIGRAVWTDKML